MEKNTNQASATTVPPHEVQTLLEWKAPGRPFIKRGRQFYLTSLFLMLPVQIILFLFSQYLLMLVVLSFGFMVYAFATVPPHDFHYRISSEGVRIEDHFYLWKELYDFYFKKRSGALTLNIRTHTILPGILIIPITEEEREKIKSTLLPYLPYREYVKPTFMERAGEWLTKNFPLESA